MRRGAGRIIPVAIAAAVAATAVPGGAAAPPGASAYFAPGARIVSVSPEKREQADDSTSAVDISDDGRYVVFQTRARNIFADDDPDPPGQFRVGGIFRRDLQTGDLELVASGELRDDSAPDTVAVRGAANPSVSADGRYVAFSTGWQLSAADTNGNVDVYVRDMNRPIGDPAAFDLVSARNGSNAGAIWGPPAEDHPGRNVGAEVTAAASISADGQRVVFRTQEASDLPAEGAATTPALQIFVRDRQAQTTTLVTRNRLTGDPAGGGLAAAVISGDGSTVVWVGREAPAQVQLLNGELENSMTVYYLYRRVADGPSSPTRRITGSSDLDDPACSLGSIFIDDPGRTGPCYGPLARNESASGAVILQVPAVSGDGRQVAFITGTSPRGILERGGSDDLFVTDMTPGVSRKRGTRELTREALQLIEASNAIDGTAMSPDGRWLAVTTSRRAFVLPGMSLVGGARADSTARELYLFDLQANRIERAVRGWRAGDANGSVARFPSISANGRRLAFISEASNLLFGDVNGRGDAFVVDRSDDPPAESPGEVPVEPPVSSGPEDPKGPEGPPKPLMVRVRPGKPAAIRLVIDAPSRGTLDIQARGRLPGANGRPSGRARVLAALEKTVRKKSRVTLSVALNRGFRTALRKAGKLTASAEVTFDAEDGTAYARRVTVQFRQGNR